jgi:plastocyanin
MRLLGHSIGSPRALAVLATVALCLIAFAGSVSAAAPTAISIVDQSFQPADATIQVGDTVTWTVTKAIADPHSVTSGTQSDSGKVFDSGAKLHVNGDTFSQTFGTAGSFPYYCTIHPSQMHGTILVLAPGQTAPPAASAAPSASPLPQGERAPVPGTDKLIAAGILGVTLVILFGAARFWRRVNS